ncbi:hypothetical protein OQA88_10560 [Cercophora sp. LCS_1]
MPLLYGEGRKRAFLRLQEQILQQTEDQSLFAWILENDGKVELDTLFGLLAPSPAEFKHSIHIEPLPGVNTQATVPCAMTSQGLRIQLYLSPVGSFRDVQDDPVEEDYFAILDCDVLRGGRHCRPAIRLRRLSEDQYARVHIISPIQWAPLPPPPDSQQQNRDGYRTIYVRQTPLYHSLPRIQISPSNQPCCPDHNPMAIPIFSLKGGSPYALLDATPRSNWSSHTMTMTVDYTREPRLVAAFRFVRRRHNEDRTRRRLVDVVVGIQRLDALRWKSWCFQLGITPSQDLATAFTKIEKKMQDVQNSADRNTAPDDLCALLGEDIPSIDVTLVAMEQQGRPYISIQVSDKTPPPPKQVSPPTPPRQLANAEHGDRLPLEMQDPPAPPFAANRETGSARNSVTLSVRPYITYSSSPSSRGSPRPEIPAVPSLFQQMTTSPSARAPGSYESPRAEDDDKVAANSATNERLQPTQPLGQPPFLSPPVRRPPQPPDIPTQAAESYVASRGPDFPVREYNSAPQDSPEQNFSPWFMWDGFSQAPRVSTPDSTEMPQTQPMPEYYGLAISIFDESNMRTPPQAYDAQYPSYVQAYSYVGRQMSSASRRIVVLSPLREEFDESSDDALPNEARERGRRRAALWRIMRRLTGRVRPVYY